MFDGLIGVYGNCHSDIALGDFSFAANFAYRLVHHLKFIEPKLKVVLLTEGMRGKDRFYTLYPKINDNFIHIEGEPIPFYDIDAFSTDKKLVIFIEAGNCRRSSIYRYNRIVDIDTHMVFLGAPHWPKPTNGKLYRTLPFFSAIAGIGEKRLGITKIKLPKPAVLTNEHFGFIYLKPDISNVKTILQFIKLTKYPHYKIVGEHEDILSEIRMHLPEKVTLELFKSLPQRVIHDLLINSQPITLVTGNQSALESMTKVIFYQYLEINKLFVEGYLAEFKRLAHQLTDPFNQTWVSNLISAVDILMAPKPLSDESLVEIDKLISSHNVCNGIAIINQKIFKMINGKLINNFWQLFLKKHAQVVPMGPEDIIDKPNFTVSSAIQAFEDAANREAIYQLKYLYHLIPKTKKFEEKIVEIFCSLIKDKRIVSLQALIKLGVSPNMPYKKLKKPLDVALTEYMYIDPSMLNNKLQLRNSFYFFDSLYSKVNDNSFDQIKEIIRLLVHAGATTTDMERYSRSAKHCVTTYQNEHLIKNYNNNAQTNPYGHCYRLFYNSQLSTDLVKVTSVESIAL